MKTVNANLEVTDVKIVMKQVTTRRHVKKPVTKDYNVLILTYCDVKCINTINLH